MNTHHRIYFLLGVFLLFVFWGNAAPLAEAGYGWPYHVAAHPFYGGYYPPSLYVREYIPYSAQYPPVYYSYPVARPYGYSPYAYPPGTVTPERHRQEPAVVSNPYVVEASPAKVQTTAPLRIVNPYVEQPEQIKEAAANLQPKPQIIYPISATTGKR